MPHRANHPDYDLSYYYPLAERLGLIQSGMTATQRNKGLKEAKRLDGIDGRPRVIAKGGYDYVTWNGQSMRAMDVPGAEYSDNHDGFVVPSTLLDVALTSQRTGAPLEEAIWGKGETFASLFPNAEPPVQGPFSSFADQSFIDAGDLQTQYQAQEAEYKGKKYDSVNMGKQADRSEAMFSANMMISQGDPANLRRPWDVAQDSAGNWSYFFKIEKYEPPKTKEAAQALVDDLNNSEVSTFGGKFRWVVGAKDTSTDIFHVRRESVPEDAEKIDPNQPFMLNDDKKPVRMDLPDGSTVFVTSDNRFVHSGPEDDGGVPAWLTDDFDGTDVKVVTVGEGDNATDWMVWPDGSRTEIGDKYTGGIAPDDLEVIGEEKLKDGTWVQFLNNGQILRTGRERVDASTEWDDNLKKYRVTQPDGSIQYEEPADPTYDPGLVTIPTDVGDYRFFEQRTGAFDEVGLPEVPAQIETMTGPGGEDLGFGVRGTQGGLLPLDGVLDRVIEQAIINGDVEKAIAFDDFRKRPSRAEALKMALEFARSPADQVLISAISAGETYIAPPSPGELQRVGPQADFLVQAYQEFRDTLTGGRLPTSEEFTAAMAPTPEPVSELDQLKIEGQKLANKIATATLEQMALKGEDDHAKSVASIKNTEANTASTETKTKIAVDKNESDKEEKAASKISADVNVNGGTDTGSTGSDPAKNAPASTETAEVQASAEEIWTKLNEAQKTFFTNQYAQRYPTAGAPDGAQAIEEFYRTDSSLFEQAIKFHLSSHFPSGSDAGPPLTGQESTGIFQGIPYYVDPVQAVKDAEAVAIQESQKAAANRLEEQERIASILSGETEATFNIETGSGVQEGDWTGSWDYRGREGGGSGALAGEFGEGTTFADVAAALNETVNPVREVAPDVQKEQDIAAARSEKMDLASALAGARSAAGGRDYWEDDPGVIAAQEAFDLASEKLTNIRGMAGGGIVGRGEVTMVGEKGPELAVFPTGTEIIPLGRPTPGQARHMQRTGRAYANGGEVGGVVFPADEDISLDRYGGTLPSGVRRTIAGQPIAPSAGRLFRAAGLGVPSGQALRNMLPEDLEVYQDIGAQAGIPEGAFQRELALGIPSGERKRGSARFLPLSLRS